MLALLDRWMDRWMDGSVDGQEAFRNGGFPEAFGQHLELGPGSQKAQRAGYCSRSCQD